MNKSILAAVAVIASVGALAQGTLNLSTTKTYVPSDQFVFDADGVTKLEGAAWLAQISVGPAEASLAPVGVASPFLTGTLAGKWRGSPNPATIASIIPGGAGVAQLYAWDAKYATYADAMNGGGKFGKSEVFAVTTGGQGQPPAVPGNLVNFKGFSLIPEPSTIALGLLGAASLLFFRRK
jgi:hypothetical protein